MKYEYSFVLTEQDYLDFNDYNINSNPVFKKRMLFARVFIIWVTFFCSLWFLIQAAASDNDLRIGFIVAAVAFLILGIIWFFSAHKINRGGVKKQIRKLLKTGKLYININITVCADDEELTECTPESETKYKYSIVERIGVGKSGVYIYIGAVQAVVLPNRVFADENEKKELIKFLTEKMTRDMRPNITIQE